MSTSKRPYLGGCAAGGGMSGQRRVAVAVDGTTAVEEWVRYWCLVSPQLKLGHYFHELNLMTNKKVRALLHSPMPAKTHKYHMEDISHVFKHNLYTERKSLSYVGMWTGCIWLSTEPSGRFLLNTVMNLRIP
jgi:hypothetical protein